MERVDAAAASRSAGVTSTRSWPTQSTSGGCRIRGKTYDGQHPAIVEQATWDSAQAQLASHAHRRACRQLACAHLLMGRIQDDRGHAMTPTHTQKGSRRYRYYVSQA